MTPDGGATLRRIAFIIAALSAAGLLAWLAARGVRAAVSFAAGAAVSSLSLWWLNRMVRSAEQAIRDGRPPGPGTLLHSLRLLLLGGGIYGILRIYEVFVPALVTGLLVAVTAITLEALYEWLYGPTS